MDSLIPKKTELKEIKDDENKNEEEKIISYDNKDKIPSQTLNNKSLQTDIVYNTDTNSKSQQYNNNILQKEYGRNDCYRLFKVICNNCFCKCCYEINKACFDCLINFLYDMVCCDSLNCNCNCNCNCDCDCDCGECDDCIIF